jgi:aminopeptidase N
MAFLPPEDEGRAGVARRDQQLYQELMPYHEVAHQWWGNVVTWSSYRDEWIEEALANYCALLYFEERKPGEHALAPWLENYRNDLLTKIAAGERIYDDAGPLALGQRLDSSLVTDGYARVIYAKGTWVMHMLRMMLREPGSRDPDARFSALLRGLIEKHRGSTLSTAEFQRATERVMTAEMALDGSRSMDWFFDQWVRGTGIPRYVVEFTVRQQGESYLTAGTLKQSAVAETFLARVPLYAAGSLGKPVFLGAVVTAGGSTPFRFTSRVKPRHIVIDPNQTLLWRAQ